MPKIFDNIENHLKTGLLHTLKSAHKADFCVGYFNLRGWKILQDNLDHLTGGENCCRLLVGMQRPEEDLIKKALSNIEKGLMDNPTALALKKEIAQSFRRQLTFGIPTSEDEACLQKLKRQMEEGKVVVKLYLGHPLHAKLYLLHREDYSSPLIGFVGSSNLTMSGLSAQGELNVDVVEEDAAKKLSQWFEDRWNDRWCLDITKELIQIIEESWAGEHLLPPYYIYLKMAYHLSQEARTGINNYIIPKALKEDLLPFQANAVSVAARHLDKRGGVLIGDVVGLGKTLTATAVAKLFEETFYTETLIICPKNLKEMWESYIHQYQLRAVVKSISTIKPSFVEKTRRFRVVIIDESHNLRNRQGKRYAVVKEYIEKNESRVILLTATPYNKTYGDISSQLRLFIPEDRDIGITPENFIRIAGGPIAFIARYQYSPNTLLAFEKSTYSEDWQELLKMYMVRRTRTFIKNNYATWSEERKRFYISFNDGRHNYFPDRKPKKVEFSFDENDETDIYVKLYSADVVNAINSLHLARYGLGNFIDGAKEKNATESEKKILGNLSRAGRRLMGFSRTNLFKRLESSGYSFLLSLAKHVLRNYVFIHAIENGLDLPIGQQEAGAIDEFKEEREDGTSVIKIITDKEKYRALAEGYYNQYHLERNKYRWINSSFFQKSLVKLLQHDIDVILNIIELGKDWDAAKDKKLNELEKLCSKKHKKDKVLIFTQFADTATYLSEQLKKRGIKDLEGVTGGTLNPTEYAQRFSPKSNKIENCGSELRILISTDVLSEGQNLQDAHIIVNYDLPWALIRLIQRAGRVDRIGQEADTIFCYSFLPQEGLNRIIRLRDRLRQRIRQNSEVVGSDEVFFDGDPVNIADLYNEKSGILDDEDGEVDLTSQAYEIWNSAIKANPDLKKKIPSLPDVVYSTKPVTDDIVEGEGVITYHRNSNGYEVLTWLDKNKKVISQSQSRILKVADCALDTPPVERLPEHHAIVQGAVEIAEKEAAKTGGQLGSEKSARYRTYMMLNRYYDSVKKTLFESDALKKTIDEIYQFPFRETARELINRRLKMGIQDEQLASLAIQLREEGRLCQVDQKQEENIRTPQIICSLGIKAV